MVAIVQNRSGTTHYTSGRAILRPARPIRVTDRLRVASITKTFVAAVVLQLVGERRLSLDENVTRWLPGVLPTGHTATVRQLLNHTSGIPDFPDEPTFARFREDVRLFVPAREAVAIATAAPSLFGPGDGWSYSNTGYEVLGLLIERLTGDPIAKVLSERILVPLRLDDTSFEPRPGRPRALAHGYALPGSDLAQAAVRPRDVTDAVNPGASASGALVSTIGDVARFYHALFSGELLPKELLAEMMKTVPTGGPNQQGLGVFRYPVSCGSAWGHGGFFPGYVTAALASRDGSHVVVLGANAASGALSDALFDAAKAAYCHS